MEYVIRFAISLFDLAVFMYYFHSNKKMKPVSKVWILAGFTIAAIIWTFVSNIKNPYLNLATLLIVLILLSFYYESGMWTRIINIVTFMGIGMLFEPVALLLLHAMNFHMGESYKYYFVMVICSFVRGNVMYILSKLISKKGMQIAAFPKEILGVLVMVFTFTVLNCCFIILLSLEAGSEKSLLMCASIVISLVLTDYFMLYMMERFNYLVQKQYEDAMYREEMHYKDIYYEEAEKQNKEVQKLKHDMKHKLHELYHLVENSDGQELSEKIGAMCKEFEQIDENVIYAARTLGISEWKIFWKIRLPMAKPGIISGVTLAFARAIGEYGATSMLAGNIAGKTSTISQQIAMVVQSGDYATAGFWCIVIIAISFACLVSINMICGKSKGIKRKRKNNVAHSKNKKTVG